jgi:hypothetical protein
MLAALQARSVRTDVHWRQETDRARRVELGLGAAQEMPDEVLARAHSLQVLQSRGEKDCLDAAASGRFRAVPGRSAAVLEDVVYACAPYRGQVHCAATAIARCRLDVREDIETERCDVAP